MRPITSALETQLTLGYPSFLAAASLFGKIPKVVPLIQQILIGLSSLACVSPLIWVIPPELVMPETLAKISTVAVLGFFGFLYLVQAGLGQGLSLAVGGLIAGPSRRGARVLKRVFTRMAEKIPRTEGRSMTDEYGDFLNGLKGFTPRLTLTIAAITLLGIAISCLQLYFIAYVLGLPLNFLEIVGVISATTFINLIPISINGLGTRDAFLVLTLPLLGVDRDLALAYSLSFLLLFTANTVMALPFWLFGSASPAPAVEPPASREVPL